MPATDVDFEREFEELVRDLRALPTAAPAGVREHVRALGEPARPRTLHDLLLMLSWRRSLLVLAPVCVLALVSAAVIHGVVNSGGNSSQTAVAAQKQRCASLSAAPSTAVATATTPFRGRDGRPGGALVADAGCRPLSGLRSLADRSRQERRCARTTARRRRHGSPGRTAATSPPSTNRPTAATAGPISCCASR